MDEEEALLIALLVVKKRQIMHQKKQKKHNRKIWIRKIFTERSWKGEYHQLIKEMKLYDHEYFYKQFRMSPTRYEELLQLVAPLITKSSVKREAICPAERLCITLRFLCSSDSNVTIACSYRVGIATVGKIIKETCVAIWQILLENNYIKAPDSEEEWLRISEGFESAWNFPNCVGAIDGKHVVMQAPPRSGSSYFNYKKTHSIVLMAVCNSKYEFTLVDIGDSGRESDGSVFAASGIGNAILNNSLNFPEPQKLTGSDTEIPYVIVGDEAFPLKCNLMKPYSRAVLDEMTQKEISIIGCHEREGFRRPIVSSPENVKNITKAAVALHNFLILDSGYCPFGLVDTDRRRGEWRQEIEGYQGFTGIARTGSNNYAGDAKTVRDKLCEYFNSSGAVPWQTEYIHKQLDMFDQQ